jgi:hypothetical protein
MKTINGENKMTQEHETFDLALGIYLLLEGCKITNFIQSKRNEKPVLQLRIINEDPSKDLDKLMKHYEEDLRPFLGSGRRGKIAVNSGDRDFELSLLRAILGGSDNA